jgi:hypothetical protein
MPGEHISRLVASVTGMNEDDVRTSADHWDAGALSLGNVARMLARAEQEIIDGFGAGSTVGPAAQAAFATLRTTVLEPRRAEMLDARDALHDVDEAMVSAQAASADMPDSAPGPAPRFTAGTGDERDDIQRLKIHSNQMRAHNLRVSAYADAEERARQELVELNRRYDEAAAVMARIHGEPVPDRTTGGGGGSTPSGGAGSAPGLGPGAPVASGPTGSSTTLTGLVPGPGQDPTTGTVTGPPTGPTTELPTGPTTGLPTDSTTSPVTGPVVVPESLPTPPTGPTGSPGAGSDPLAGYDTSAGAAPGGAGAGPLTAGAAAGAGALGGLGAKGLLGRLSTSATAGAVGAGGTPTRPLGAGGRAASSGVLGRGGAPAAGGQPARGGGAGAMGAGGAGRGAGGQRGAGARGAAAGGAGGRGGRSKDDPRRSRRSEYDVEEDWLDDEGSPGVLD